ncbi:MAG: RNA polymerase sigma-70 factor (ECF subfamily) [Candidatus Paceibacteria bacterium]|jgi:RNA polymerase sigma-70 factor (ECF subfamily)
MIAGAGGIHLAKTMTSNSPNPNIEALLVHSQWVRALAGSLVADSSTADDVQQEVWLQILKSSPKRVDNLRGWLGSVVRNTVAQKRRSEGRSATRHKRLNRESDSLTGAGPHQSAPSTPQELAEKMETFQALAYAIGELEEPYSSAIYLRFVDELSVAEVAQRQEVPVPTATSRIQRGIELLRAQMQGRFGDSWRARCLVFTPLVSRAAIPFLIGVITMSLKAKVLFGVVLLALLVPLYSQWMKAGLAPAGPGEGGLLKELSDVVTPVDKELTAALQVNSEVSLRRDEQAATIATPQANPRDLRVVVRDATTLELVRGAEVLYFDRASEQDEAWGKDQFTRFDDVEILLDRYGDRFSTDDEGRVILPARKSYAHIGARFDGSFAAIYLFEDPERDGGTEVELLLRPAVTILVKVIDSLGRPVPDQRVEYQNAFGDRFAQCLRPQISDGSGIALFQNMQEGLAEGRSSNTHRFALPVPGGVVAHEFLLDQPPTEVVTLQLPETGDLRILLRDSDGNPGRDGMLVYLEANGPAHAIAELRRANSLRGTLSARSRDGAVLFKNIALNTEVVGWMEVQGRTEPVEVIGQGPRTLGHEAQLTLRVPPVPSIGNLLVSDGEGHPLSQRTLSVQQVLLIAGREPDPIHLRMGTNAEGRVRFYQDRLVQAEDPGAASASMLTIAIQTEEGCMRWGVQSWAALIDAGEVDLGELVLGPELIHSGVVYDEEDQPLAFAEFSIRIPTPWPDGEEHQIQASFKADQAGRFRVLGAGLEPGTELEAFVSVPGTEQVRAMGETKFALIVGDLDQSLRLNKALRVEGRILIPVEVPHDKLQLNLELTDTAGELSYHFIELERANGRFSQGRFPAGRGQLVLMGSGALELARSEHFSTEGTGVLTPAGWEALDLRGRLFVHEIELKGADGSHPERAKVKLVDLAMEVTDTNPVRLVTLADPLRIVVECEGYRPSLSTLISGQAEIELAVGIPIVFALPQSVELPEGTWQLQVVDTAALELGIMAYHKLKLAPDGRSWITALPHPGAYMLALGHSLEQASGPGSVKRFTAVLWPDGQRTSAIEISDGSEAQTILLDVSQAAVDDCVR